MFADNHANKEIPQSELVSGFKVAQISVGVAITLPAFLVAAETFSALGFYTGLVALAAAGLILFMVASGTMIVGARTRVSTYTIIAAVFGRIPAIGVNLLIVAVLLGWFAVTISIFGSALLGALQNVTGLEIPLWIAKVSGGVLMTLITLYGFHAIDKLSRVIVPLLALMLVAAFFVGMRNADFAALLNSSGDRQNIKSLGEAISILVGAFMVGVTIVPDMARFLRAPSHAILASGLSYGFGSQLVFVFSGVPALVTGEKDFVANLLAIGFGFPALFVVTFATLTTNVNNLYSTSLSLRQVFATIRDSQMTLLAGSVGTAVALLGIENVFIPFLVFLGIAIPPIAGVYTTHILSGRAKDGFGAEIGVHKIAVAAWFIGALGALISTNHWIDLTFIPAIDGFLISAIFYLAAKTGQDRVQR
ncbi:MAG: cytosine permease [Pseudomonadota bacterium]